jgi:D-alanyl-D-alanine carboxypeptidase
MSARPPSPLWRVGLIVVAAFGVGAGAALALNSSDDSSTSSTTFAVPEQGVSTAVTTPTGQAASPAPSSTSPAPTPTPTSPPPTNGTTGAETATSPAPPASVPATLPPPADLPAAPEVDAAAYVVFDASTGRQLTASNADEPRAVGSLMKLLNAYVVTQAGEPERVVTVPPMQLDTKESQIGLYAGEQLSRAVLQRAMLIVSANDAAQALAVDVAGSTSAFVEQMNTAAAGLGMTSTVAKNPIGLDAEGQQSTAHDVMLLSRTLMADETFRATVMRPTASLHGMTFSSSNDLLTTYPGADGIKTGHTSQAGYCLAASATRDGRQVFVVVLGSSTKAGRVAAVSALLDWAFAQPA